MSRVTAKQAFGECARTMMSQSEIMASQISWLFYSRNKFTLSEQKRMLVNRQAEW